jgi:hypothetical protein
MVFLKAKDPEYNNTREEQTQQTEKHTHIFSYAVCTSTTFLANLSANVSCFSNTICADKD